MPRPRTRSNGEGTVYYHPKRKKWIAELVTSIVGKRRVRVTCRADTQRKAREWLTEQIRDRDTGTAVAKTKDSLGEWLTHWITNIVPLKRPKPSTLDFYRRMAKYADKIAATPLQKLTAEHIEELYGSMLERGLSARTVVHVHRVLSLSLKVAQRRRKVKFNVCDHVETPSIEAQEMQVLTQAQAAAFINATQKDGLHAMFLLAIQLGLRMGELLGLRWKDIEPDGSLIHIRQTVSCVNGKAIFGPPKTKKSRRTLPLPTNIAMALRFHQLLQGAERERKGDAYADNDLVFATPLGTPMNQSRIHKHHFKPALKRAGCPPIRFHDLRHTAVTLMRQVLKLDLETVSFICGHTNATVTLGIYSHLFEEDKKKVAQALDGLWTTT
jgi:integrase